MLRIETKSGSTYILDREKMTWKRENSSSKIRTEDGDMRKFPDLRIGEPMVIIGTPLQEGYQLRRITTTPVVVIGVVAG